MVGRVSVGVFPYCVFVCLCVYFVCFLVKLYVYLFVWLFGKSGGACLCWCVPIPCVAQQMKQLSGDNFSPPHPATLQKLQKDKKFKNY